MTTDDIDVTSLIDFAKAYNRLGWAIQEQLDDLLAGNDDLNPNAIEEIRRNLADFHPDIDEACQRALV